jgi:hypothetical protein
MGILPMSFPSPHVCRITGIALARPSHLSEQVRPGSTGEWGQKNELPSFKIQKSHSRGTHSDQQIILKEETASSPAPSGALYVWRTRPTRGQNAGVTALAAFGKVERVSRPVPAMSGRR